MVVGHFRGIHAPGVQSGKIESASVLPEQRHGNDFFQQGGYIRHDIFGYVPAARSRVRDQFLLVQGLGDGKSLVRRKVVVDVAVLLKGGQVIQKWGLLENRATLHFGDCHRRAGNDASVCRFRRFLVPEVLRMDEQPVRLSLLQRDMKLPVWCGDEVAVLLEARAYHGEGRGLYPSDGVVRRTGDCRQRAAGVHAHQPVRLRPAVRGRIEAVVFISFPEVCHPLSDGLIGKRGEPQAFERLGTAQVGIYPPEDEFPLTPGIGRHDDAVTFGEHPVDDLELPAGGDVRHHAPVRTYLSFHKTERFGKHRKVFGGGSRVAVCSRQCQ